MAFHHVVLLNWTSDLTKADIKRFAAGLNALPNTISSIRSYAAGPGLFDGNWNFGISASFDDEAGWREYDLHPDHQTVRAIVAGKIAERAAAQFMIE
jgi:hypothetical protein